MRFSPNHLPGCTLVRSAVLLTAVLLPPAASAAETINVTLQDATTSSSMSGMRMTASPATVKAGPVTIHASNQSQGLVHEVIVVRSKDPATLPYDSKAARVVESRIDHLGEVSDLAPGKSGSLTLTLTPGSYLLICNQPNHYKAGMWTRLTVTQ